MNYQFSAIYAIIFALGIAGAFFALKEGILYWSSHESFLIDSFSVASKIELMDYFDECFFEINLSEKIFIEAKDGFLFFKRGDFLKSFNSSAFFKKEIVELKDFTITKDLEGFDFI